MNEGMLESACTLDGYGGGAHSHPSARARGEYQLCLENARVNRTIWECLGKCEGK